MMLLLGILFLLYTLGLLWVMIGQTKLARIKKAPGNPTSRFSIVIPFRNEGKRLPLLLKSLAKLEYPKDLFEIIWVNDASDDASESLVRDFINHTPLQQRLLQNTPYSNAPKKDALTLAVKQANHQWIITTDADCQVPPFWLDHLDRYIQQFQPKMVAGPVKVFQGETFLEAFQALDFISLQAVTRAGFGWEKPLLCNGANLAFDKDPFFEVNGYEGNNHLATGDDLFLMMKIKNLYPNDIHFLNHPEAMVTTLPVQDWNDLISQRVRWASKTRFVKNTPLQILGLAIALGNIAFVLSCISIFIWPLDILPFLGLLFFKLILDTAFLLATDRFEYQKIGMGSILLGVCMYPFVFLWILGQSWRGEYQWKGRSFKK